jgi:hypothetical protein
MSARQNSVDTRMDCSRFRAGDRFGKVVTQGSRQCDDQLAAIIELECAKVGSLLAAGIRYDAALDMKSNL